MQWETFYVDFCYEASGDENVLNFTGLYEFYEEEGVRLVYVTKEKPFIEWDDNTKTPQYYISRKFEEMPFKIDECIIGCNCENPDSITNIISSIADDSMNINFSEIKGYKK